MLFVNFLIEGGKWVYEESFLIYGTPPWVVRGSPGGLEVGSVAKSGFRVLVPGNRKFNSLHGHGGEEMKEQEVQCVGDRGRTFDRKLEIPSCFNSPLINKKEIPLGSEHPQEKPLRFMDSMGEWVAICGYCRFMPVFRQDLGV